MHAHGIRLIFGSRSHCHVVGCLALPDGTEQPVAHDRVTHLFRLHFAQLLFGQDSQHPACKMAMDRQIGELLSGKQLRVQTNEGGWLNGLHFALPPMRSFCCLCPKRSIPKCSSHLLSVLFLASCILLLVLIFLFLGRIDRRL